MDDAHEAAETEHPESISARPAHAPPAGDEDSASAGYLRLPWMLVAVGLLGVVAVALAIGLLANRYLRPQVGLVPTPGRTAAVVAAAPPTPAPTVTAPPAPTVTAQPAPTVTAPPAPTATAQPAPKATPVSDEPTPIATTPMPLVLTAFTATPTVAESAGSPTPATDASPTASALPTVEPALADEVGKAYVTFWRVSSQALLELDQTHLSEVMDGDYLQSFETHLDDLRAQGRAIKSQVTLNYKVVQATNQDATLVDTVEDDSFYVVPGTDQALTEPANDILRLQVKLTRTEGIWKVVESVSAD